MPAQVQVLSMSWHLPVTMAEDSAAGRPLPLLVLLLGVSFLMMILSGVFYGLGLPEDVARAFFIATVIVWCFLGAAVIIQGQLETRAIAAHQRGEAGTDVLVTKGGVEDEGAE